MNPKPLIKIKEIAGGSAPYTEEYSASISASAARKLCGMYPLPRPGYETVVAVTHMSHDIKTMKLRQPQQHDALLVRVQLCVANIGCAYVLQSSSIPVADWEEVFGLTLQRYQRKPVSKN